MDNIVDDCRDHSFRATIAYQLEDYNMFCGYDSDIQDSDTDDIVIEVLPEPDRVGPDIT